MTIGFSTIPEIGSGKTNQSLLARIRAAMARSANGNNSAERAPLLAPPAWVLSTAYIQGQVVTNTGGGAGNLYICTVAGTSAGSGGPTGQGSALIVDGTVTWQYFGVVLTATSSPLAPAVSTALYSTNGSKSYFWYAPSTVTQAYAPGTPAYFYFEGLWNQATLSGGTLGGTSYGQLGQSTGVATVTGPNGNSLTASNWQNPSSSYTFYTDAPKFMIGGLYNVFPSVPAGGFIEIDDVPLQDTPQWNTATANAGILLDFTAVGGRKTRKIRVYNAHISGVSTFDNVSQVWAYQPENEYRIGWIGDSISAGSAGGPVGEANNGAITRTCRMIGNENVYNQAVGGMGFIAPVNGYNFLSTAQTLALYSPDLVIVAGNFDDNGLTSAARQNQVVAFLKYVRGILPNCFIVVFGVWSPPSLTNALALETDLQTAVATFNDAYTYFIPLATRASGNPWVTGTGNIGALSTGNSSSYVYTDNTHPICLAHKEYIPKVYAAELRRLFNSVIP